MARKITDSIKDVIHGVSCNTFVEKPCKIINVHPNQTTVDVEYYDNYKTDILYNVPVKHIQTKNAYIFLKLQAGDRGTVRFLDNDSSYYNKGSEENGNDTRTHNINDGIFALGFYPKNEQIEFTSDDIVIKSGNATISFSNGNINISGGTICIAGINFLDHTHTVQNNITGGVISQGQQGGT